MKERVSTRAARAWLVTGHAHPNTVLEAQCVSRQPTWLDDSLQSHQVKSNGATPQGSVEPTAANQVTKMANRKYRRRRMKTEKQNDYERKTSN